jgi:hypothetical protein
MDAIAPSAITFASTTPVCFVKRHCPDRLPGVEPEIDFRNSASRGRTQILRPYLYVLAMPLWLHPSSLQFPENI